MFGKLLLTGSSSAVETLLAFRVFFSVLLWPVFPIVLDEGSETRDSKRRVFRPSPGLAFRAFIVQLSGCGIAVLGDARNG